MNELEFLAGHLWLAFVPVSKKVKNIDYLVKYYSPLQVPLSRRLVAEN